MIIPKHLVNEKFDDIYFDIVDAIDEAQQIYFKNNNLIERISIGQKSKAPLIIGEVGFGAGRIAVSLMQFIQKSGLKNVSIQYNSVELYPLESEKMINILNGFRDRVGQEIDALMEAYKKIDISVTGWHSMKIQEPFGTLEINLWIGEALEMVKALEGQCDVWFLDGHSPKKNPSMWRPELLMAIGEKTKTGGSCATFSVAAAVRDALIAAGFSLKRHPGCGGKKQVLQGIKD